MSHDDECIHGLMIGTCSWCKPQPAVEGEPVRVFRAKYEGHCSGCNLPITVGQMVAWSPDRPAMHEGCS